MSEATGVRLRRLGATVIDMIILGPVALLVMLATGIVESAEAWVMPQPLVRLTVLVVGTYILLNGYHLVTAGQTLGKRLLGIRIQSTVDGSLLPAWKHLLRPYAVLVVGIVVGILLDPRLIAAIYLINIAFIFGPAQRCLHDFLVDSSVVRCPTGS